LALLQAHAQTPLSSVAIEVPAFVLRDPALSRATRAAQEAGCRMWVKGRGALEVGTTLKGWFTHLAYDLPEAPPAPRGAIAAVACGVASITELEDAMRRGAALAAGWPLVDVKAGSAATRKVAPEMQVVMDLIGRIDREEPVERIEAALKGDPSLAFRLLRYLNSAAFGLAVEITSFRHAMMMLGYAKLKRWLALLLVSASKDPNQLPVMHAAVRRGLLMEELGLSLADADMRGELFLCGLFSLLDRMLQQPFAELFRSVPMPERVRQALGDDAGPFMPYLALVQAVESGSPFDRQAAADALLIDTGEVNRALLAALATARQLDN
jgi:EAL and modified HD-GYP domain-containing signal transduction protein